MSARLVSNWDNKGVRVGWTIRAKNGTLGVVTWINNGCAMYRQVHATTESEIEIEIAQIRQSLGLE